MPPVPGHGTVKVSSVERRHLETAAQIARLEIHPALPENTMADAERWAAALPNPAYAIDDETAVKVADGVVEIVSEGRWRLF